MHIETAIKDLVERTVAEYLGTVASSAEPDLITTDEAAHICCCDKSVILELVRQREANGFPAVILGARTIRIDKRRLLIWFAQGGLGMKQ